MVSLMPFLKMVFCIVLFISLYEAVKYFYYKNNKNIHDARGENISSRQDHILQKLQNYFSHNGKTKGIIAKRDLKLKKMGYPLKFNGFLYYFYKITILFILLFIIILQIASANLVIALALLFIFPDVFFQSLKRKEKNQILGDLAFINDVLNIQSGSAGMELGTALKESFDISKCKRLKDALIELSIEISLTKNIPESLDKFEDKFDIPELDSFVLALKQAAVTGRCKDLLDSQSELLKDSAIERESLKTKQIDMYVGFIGVLIFLGIAPLMLFSFITQISVGLKGLF